MGGNGICEGSTTNGCPHRRRAFYLSFTDKTSHLFGCINASFSRKTVPKAGEVGSRIWQSFVCCRFRGCREKGNPPRLARGVKLRRLQKPASFRRVRLMACPAKTSTGEFQWRVKPHRTQFCNPVGFLPRKRRSMTRLSRCAQRSRVSSSDIFVSLMREPPPKANAAGGQAHRPHEDASPLRFASLSPRPFEFPGFPDAEVPPQQAFASRTPFG